MSTYSFDIAQRIKAAFPKLNPVIPDTRYVPGVVLNNIEAVQNLQGLGKGNQSKYQTNNASAWVSPPAFDVVEITNPVNYSFPVEPILSFGFDKNIQVTEVQGGTPVVEYIGEKPIAIKISGIFWNEDGTYPEKQIRAFLNVWRQNTILDVVSRQFGTYGIKRIYIANVEFPPMAGYLDTQPFEIEAYSYKDVKLIITENPVK